ncbi:MAG: B12-binding domain-containing radical SAM protein [Flavonifractor plautii]
MKIRFLEPGNRPYKPTPLNYFVYDRYIRTPSVGLNTLATIVKELVDDTYMYSESISRIDMDDVEDADIVFIGIFTFAAVRGYELADHLRAHGRGLVVLGGLHASMNCAEAARHCDYVLLGEGDETIRAFVEAVGRGSGRTSRPGLDGGEELRSTGYPPPPERFETIADRNLVHNYSKMVGTAPSGPRCTPPGAAPQLRLLRPGAPLRPPRPHPFAGKCGGRHPGVHPLLPPGPRPAGQDLWLTDDNFFADRDWAMSVLRAIVDSGIRYRFNVQARYEVGFDDEMLDLLRQAGFFELDLGIEFLDDASFATYHKKSTRQEIIDAIRNIRAHGLSVRGCSSWLRRPGGGRGRPAGRLRHPEPHPGHPDPVYVLRPRHAGIRGQPGPAAPPGLVEIQRQRRPLPPPHDPLPAPTGAHPGQPENLLLAAALLRPGAGGPHPQGALFGGIFLAHERAQRFEKGAALPQADLRTGRVRASLEARTLSLSKKSFRQAAELFETLETFQKVV